MMQAIEMSAAIRAVFDRGGAALVAQDLFQHGRSPSLFRTGMRAQREGSANVVTEMVV